jgi:hypothetical protein
MSVICKYCKKDFKLKWRFDRHVESSKCTQRYENDAKSIEENKCKYCMKGFTTPYYRNTHEKTCKCNDEVRQLELELQMNKNFEFSYTYCRFCDREYNKGSMYRHIPNCKEKKKYLEELKELKEKRTEECKKSKLSEGAKIINNNINITNNITNNIIMLRPYKEPNLEYLTQEDMMMLLERIIKNLNTATEDDKLMFVERMTKMIYANEKHPENHSILIPYENRRQATVWNGTNFEVKNRDEVEGEALGKIAGKAFGELDISDEENKRLLEARSIDRFVKKFICGAEDMDGGNEKETKDNRMAIRSALLQKRRMIKETQKKYKGKEKCEEITCD